MCLLLFASSVCFGADVKQVLTRAGLVEREIPAGDAWRLANRNPVDYVVTDHAGQLAVTEQRNFRRPPSANVPFHGKSLLGTNNGEWGGTLSVVDTDGTATVLVPDNVVQLLPEQDALFAFTGLAHLGSDRGAVYRIADQDGQVTAQKLTLLPGAPAVVTAERNDRGYLAFLVVTTDGLVSFNPTYSEMKVLAIDQFWHGLYPNSTVLLDGQLVIGMRSGVAVISLAQVIGSGSRIRKLQYFSKPAP